MEIKGKLAVVPDWVATSRGLAEQATLPDPGPPLVPLETLTDAVVNFIEDDSWPAGCCCSTAGNHLGCWSVIPND